MSKNSRRGLLKGNQDIMRNVYANARAGMLKKKPAPKQSTLDNLAAKEAEIERTMRYCIHYDPLALFKIGNVRDYQTMHTAGTKCKCLCGVKYRDVSEKWFEPPCIDGHLLPEEKRCAKWIPRNREQAIIRIVERKGKKSLSDMSVPVQQSDNDEMVDHDCMAP